MFKTTLSALALCVMSTASYAQVAAPTFPEYDSAAKCQDTASRLKNEKIGSEEIYDDCLKIENTGKQMSADMWTSVPSQISADCDTLVKEMSIVTEQPGSYAVLQACLSSEMTSYTEISEKFAALPDAAGSICLAMLEAKEIISYNMLGACFED